MNRMDLLEAWRRRRVLPWISGRLLDVGCGFNGLTRAYGSGVGVDVYAWEGIDVLVEDASKLPFKDSAFDTVTAVAMLNHVPKREEALREMRRVLRPDGRLVVTMIGPATGRIAHLLFRKDERHRGHEGKTEGEVPGMTRADVKRLLNDEGFRIVRELPFQCGLNCVFVAAPTP